MTSWLQQLNLPPHPDPRTDAYPLMESWLPTILICLAYAIGVYAWRAELKRHHRTKSPRVKNRDQQLEITTKNWDTVTSLMVGYNTFMVFYCAYMFFGCLLAARAIQYGLGCESQPNPLDQRSDLLLYYGYHFYISKFMELADTVFFLWRGKVDQVTFLHVFHHACMPMSIWPAIRYAPGGIVYMFLLLNTAVHVVMYTYYGLAAAGLYKYLWWKNYLTLAQMLQFVLLIVHQGQIFVTSTTCNYPKVFPAAIVAYAFIFLILFGNFYIKAYWRKQRLVKRAAPTFCPLTSNSDEVKLKSAAVANGYVSNGHIPSTSDVDDRKAVMRKRKDTAE